MKDLTSGLVNEYNFSSLVFMSTELNDFKTVFVNFCILSFTFHTVFYETRLLLCSMQNLERRREDAMLFFFTKLLMAIFVKDY